MSQLRERAREAWGLVKLLPWMLQLLWRSHRGATLSVVFLTFVQALVPVVQLTVTKLLMDQLVALISLPAAERAGQPVHDALWLLAAEGGAVLLGVIAGLLAGHSRNVLQEHLVLNVQRQILTQSAFIDLASYESPTYYDFLRRAQQNSEHGPIQILDALIQIGQTLLTLLSIGALVVFYKPWITLILVLTTLPSFWAMIHYGLRRFIVFDRRTPDGRRAAYFTAVLSSDVFAKEVRIWGLGSYMIEATMRLHRRFRKENIQLSKGQTTATIGGEILSTAGYYGCYLVVVLGVIAGKLTIGDLALYGGAFSRMQSLFETLLTAVANSYQTQLFARNLRIFLDLQPTLLRPENPPPTPKLQQGLRVENLNFTYPGTDEPVLQDLSFEIRPGECVAIVGENGAGKTTLVKLLLRLYDPNGGKILADGLDLRQLDPDAWRQQVGVVFQDFARFQLTVRENIGMGHVDDIENVERVEAAAREAGIHDVLCELPNGYETLLGRQFEGGIELSLGQWQRVALARALLRNAPFLIMDEPTAAMDAKAEYALYKHLRELTRDRMTLLISHRFSTVRMAHRILVIEDGRLVEEGSHDDLLSRDTRYAQMFRMQAEGYQLPAPAAGANAEAPSETASGTPATGEPAGSDASDGPAAAD